jgi:hypothetical protein
MHDLHATVLHLLGLDHERLTFRYAGRDFRLTDVYGNVAREVLYLRVPLGFLEVVDETYYVPVGLVCEDPAQQVALIELAQEGECGNWRLWVRVANLLPPKGKMGKW